jgi:N-acetyl-alpha-D-muramate 1-phosphate uridylyltransferase
MTQCVILAGGLATRLRPVTGQIPKSMVEVGGRPFLEHQLSLLEKNGVEEAVLCVGYLARQIEDHFGDGRRFGVRLTYSREEDRLLGTGGSLKRAEALLEKEFFLLYGDSYLDIDYQAVFRYFLQVDFPVLMCVYRNRNRWVRSNVSYQNGRVVAYDKDDNFSGKEYIDFGLSVFSRDILEEIPPQEPYSLDRLYRRLAGENRLAGYEVFQRFYEIGSPTGLRELRNHLR